ncbi:T9SS type A sorting domain-containing protein [Lacihabitans lacunae]|uniref:T9SS type A sorting domain-containing protein n=1 Tax=Lacihabitans lacunae TaxID=1028214 RepID=A0ABV7YP82_9BACT
MSKFYTNFIRSFLFSFGMFFLGGYTLTFAKTINHEDDKNDTLRVNCTFPSYTTSNTDVTSSTNNDGKLLILNIYNTTHYEIIEGTNTPFDFAASTVFDQTQNKIEIKNISNPTGYKIYRVRLYNESPTCFSEQTIVFEHMNFAVNREYTRLELVQGVNNSTPKSGDLVTFSTIVQNKGTKTAENVEIKVVSTETLETVTFYTEKGTYSSLGNTWVIGSLEGGKSVKLVVTAKVRAEGLSYFSSYIAKEGTSSFTYAQAQLDGVEGSKRSGTSCVTVPIAIKNDEVYNVVLKEYKSVKFYYKDASGNFSEINDKTNPALAVINKDSSLTVKQSGEYSFSKKVGDCNISSCCPIIVESCSGPGIVVDSIFCSTTVDSYSIIVHLNNDQFSIIEKVFFAMSNLNFPVLTNYLNRINALPLTSSSGFVTSLGNSKYKIENIPAFMPNVTLVSSDLTGKCRSTRIVNAPNCTAKPLGMPNLAEQVQFMTAGEFAPAFSVISKPKGVDIVWFADDVGNKVIHKGKKFRPKEPGDYYVAFFDSKNNYTGLLRKAEMREIKSDAPGKFDGVNVCDCDNPLLVPQGDLGDLTMAKAFPNPVSDILTVEYRVPKTSTESTLNFTNVNGKLMKVLPINKNTNLIKVDTIKWADGLYFYSLIVDGVRMINQKIVVSHSL